MAPGGPRRRGEFGARERIDLLLDAGSFTETGLFVRARPTGDGARRPYGDGVVTGYGTVDGRPVCVFAQDSTVFGGSMGEAFGEKTIALMDLALKTGCPVIGLNDGGGARIQEGVASLALYAELVRRNVRASGVIPQISVVLGPCAGGAAYSPAITDFTVMVDGASHMFVTGPDVIEAVTGERATAEELGGARTSNTVNGNAHFLAADEVDALDTVRDLLSYLPANNLERPPDTPRWHRPRGRDLEHQRSSYLDLRIGEAHRPGRHDGPVVLYRATEPAPHTVRDPAYERDDEALGWDEVCPRLRSYRSRGHHLSLLDPPHVDEIAAHLGGCSPSGPR